MQGSKKTQVVLMRLEAVRIDIEKTIIASTSRVQWRTAVRSVLVYWLSEFFTEGMGHTKDLETALNIARKQIEQLKLVNAHLQEEVRILRDKNLF